MGVGTPDGADPPVQEKAHSPFFTGGLRVKSTRMHFVSAAASAARASAATKGLSVLLSRVKRPRRLITATLPKSVS